MRDLLVRLRSWLVGAGEWLRASLRAILPNDRDTPEVRSLKLTVSLFVGIVGLMVVVGLVTFALAVRGQEQTLVPNVTGKELVVALQELQERELYAQVQVQFSGDAEKNVVLEQRPSAGSVVKAGKRVTLRVSKGRVLEEVEDYVGRDIDEVRSYLRALYASHNPTLVVREPLYRSQPDVAAGTILAQDPKPGTKISGLTELTFVVSRGEGELETPVGQYVGMSFAEAISELAENGLPFLFSVQKASRNQAAGTVVSQSPQPEEKIRMGESVQLIMTPPDKPPKGTVFGLFQHTLPDYPILVDLSLDVITDAGRLTLLKMKHAGGPIAVPYLVPEASDLVLTVLDQEVATQRAESYAF